MILTNLYSPTLESVITTAIAGLKDTREFKISWFERFIHWAFALGTMRRGFTFRGLRWEPDEAHRIYPFVHYYMKGWLTDDGQIITTVYRSYRSMTP